MNKPLTEGKIKDMQKGMIEDGGKELRPIAPPPSPSPYALFNCSCDNDKPNTFHEGEIKTYEVWSGRHYFGRKNYCTFCAEFIAKKGLLVELHPSRIDISGSRP